jgi:rhamnose transport system permease protein
MAGVEFSVLAGVLAGGVSLFGGKGSIPGALSGVILCTAVFYMMDFIFPVSGLALLLQTLILGAALALDVRTRSRHHE